MVDAPEILTVIDSIPHLTQYLNAMYGCRYADFFAVSHLHVCLGGAMLPDRCRTFYEHEHGAQRGLSALWIGWRRNVNPAPAPAVHEWYC